jgi:hypothetical protein
MSAIRGQNRLESNLHAAQQKKLKDINPDWPLFKPIRDQAWFINLFKLDQGDL